MASTMVGDPFGSPCAEFFFFWLRIFLFSSHRSSTTSVYFLLSRVISASKHICQSESRVMFFFVSSPLQKRFAIRCWFFSSLITFGFIKLDPLLGINSFYSPSESGVSFKATQGSQPAVETSEVQLLFSSQITPRCSEHELVRLKKTTC